MADSDYAAARRHAEEALQVSEALGDKWAIAYSRFLFGFAAVEAGDFAVARPHLEESLERFQALGDDYYWGIAAFNLSWAYGELGENERARSLAEKMLEAARASGSPRNLAFALDLLESQARDEGRFAEALPLQREGLRLRNELQDRVHIADSLGRIAATMAAVGHTRTSAVLVSRSIAANEELGVTVPLYQQTRNEQTLGLINEQLDNDEFAAAWAEGRRLTIEDAVELALER